MDESDVKQVLKRWARADDAFGEELLQRCQAVLCQGDCDCVELEDEALDMLAAAGDVFSQVDYPNGMQGGNLR